MRIFQDDEVEFDKLVGKDLWIRVRSKFDDNKDFYIKLINYTEYGVNYRKISADLINRNFGWYDDRDFGWKCYQDFEDFFYDFKIVQPRDVYTTDELIEMNNG